MLENLDLERVFRAIRIRGYVDCEVYAEQNNFTQIDLVKRQQDIRFFRSAGLSLRLWDGKKFDLLSTYDVSPKGILALLEGNNSAVECHNVPLPETNLSLTNVKVKLIQDLKKKVFNENVSPLIHYEDRVRYFEVVTTKGDLRRAREETAHFKAKWKSKFNPYFGQFEHSRNSIDGMLVDLADERPLSREVKHSLTQLNAWPVPRGDFPILWSTRAVSKLCLQFLRAFEGDLLAKDLSFLSEFELPKFEFSIREREPSPESGFDHEGVRRQAMTFLAQGNLQTIACNNASAQALRAESTGNCRRDSYLAHPTVGFWNPELFPETEEKKTLIEKMDAGIFIDDLSVNSYNPTTAAIQLRLTHASLIHHGEEGEVMESFMMGINLLDLLNNIRQFSKERKATGLLVSKQNQVFITEVSAPAALSDPLPVRGSVPASYYF